MHADTPEDVTPAELAVAFSGLYPEAPDRVAEYVGVIDEIMEHDPLDSRAIQRRIRDLVGKRKLYSAAEYILENQHDPEIDPSVPARLCEEAVQVKARLDSDVTGIEDFGLPSATDDRPGVISTGLSEELDRRLHGGVGSGELYVLLGSTGAGKSSLLIKQGAMAAMAGKRVFHVTLEINRNKCIRRYQQAWTELAYHQMVTNPSAVEGAQQRVMDNGGYVEIRDWSYENITMDDIYAAVHQHISLGNPVDVLIIDYLQLVRATGVSRKADPRHGFARVAQDARSVGVALGIPVLTAWQANRAALEKRVLTEADIAESYDLATVADILLSLNQSEDEARNNVMRIHIVKQRESSQRGSVPIEFDKDRLIVRDIPVELPGGTGDAVRLGTGNSAEDAGRTG